MKKDIISHTNDLTGFMGFCGEETPFYDYYGNQLHVGDHVNIFSFYSICDCTLVVHHQPEISNKYYNEDKQFIMGVSNIEPDSFVNKSITGVDLKDLFIDEYGSHLPESFFINPNKTIDFYIKDDFKNKVNGFEWIVVVKKKFNEVNYEESPNNWKSFKKISVEI